MTEGWYLWLLRHAKSDWASNALTDFERPLNRRGKRDAPRIGHWMADQGWFPDRVIASPARRVRQTVKRVCRELGCDLHQVQWDRRIYEAGVLDLLAVLRECPECFRRVLLVGHNPGMEDLLAWLCDSVPSGGAKPFPTASLAFLEVHVSWENLGAGKARLLSFMRPRDLPEAL